MINLSDVCYMIGHRSGKTDCTRLSNLVTVIRWLDGNFPGVEVIVVEESERPTLDIKARNVNVVCKHVVNKGFFNRSWAFNVAYKFTDKRYLICGDNDIVMNAAGFLDAANMLEQYDTVKAFRYTVDLTMQETRDMHNSTQFSGNVMRSGRGGTNFAGGMVMFTRSGFERIYGWDEDFRGWGDEDNVQEHKINKMLTKIELGYGAYHLWHTKGVTTGDAPFHCLYGKNVELSAKIKGMTKEQLDVYYSGKLVNEYGDVNKYAAE